MADALDLIEITVQIDGADILAGTMRTHGHSAMGQTFNFQYDQRYLADSAPTRLTRRARLPLDSEDRTTALDPDGLNDSLEALRGVADIFALSDVAATEIIAEIEGGTRDWRQVPRDLGARRVKIDRMELAFETEARIEALPAR